MKVASILVLLGLSAQAVMSVAIAQPEPQPEPAVILNDLGALNAADDAIRGARVQHEPTPVDRSQPNESVPPMPTYPPPPIPNDPKLNKI
jgi:hypothetical protein